MSRINAKHCRNGNRDSGITRMSSPLEGLVDLGHRCHGEAGGLKLLVEGISDRYICLSGRVSTHALGCGEVHGHDEERVLKVGSKLLKMVFEFNSGGGAGACL